MVSTRLYRPGFKPDAVIATRDPIFALWGARIDAAANARAGVTAKTIATTAHAPRLIDGILLIDQFAGTAGSWRTRREPFRSTVG